MDIWVEGSGRSWQGRIDTNSVGALEKLKGEVGEYFTLAKDAEVGYTTGGGKQVRVVRTDLQLNTFLKLCGNKRINDRRGRPTLKVIGESSLAEVPPRNTCLSPALQQTNVIQHEDHVLPGHPSTTRNYLSSTSSVPIVCRRVNGSSRVVSVPHARLDLASSGKGEGHYNRLYSVISRVCGVVDMSFTDAKGRTIDIDDDDSVKVYARHVTTVSRLSWGDIAAACRDDSYAPPVIHITGGSAPAPRFPIVGAPGTFHSSSPGYPIAMIRLSPCKSCDIRTLKVSPIDRRGGAVSAKPSLEGGCLTIRLARPADIRGYIAMSKDEGLKWKVLLSRSYGPNRVWDAVEGVFNMQGVKEHALPVLYPAPASTAVKLLGLPTVKGELVEIANQIFAVLDGQGHATAVYNRNACSIAGVVLNTTRHEITPGSTVLLPHPAPPVDLIVTLKKLPDSFFELTQIQREQRVHHEVKLLEAVLVDKPDATEFYALQMAVDAGYQFVDLWFLPQKSALCKNHEVMHKKGHVMHNGVSWARPAQWLPKNMKAELYCNEIAPSDVLAENSSDLVSPVVSGLRLLAELPDIVRNIFISRCHGGVKVRYLRNGWWTLTVIDDYLPFDHSSGAWNPSCSRNIDPCELWVPLLQKLLAKAYGSYSALATAPIEDILVDLSGLPVVVLDIADDDCDSVVTEHLANGNTASITTGMRCCKDKQDVNHMTHVKKWERELEENGLAAHCSYHVIQTQMVKGTVLVNLRQCSKGSLLWGGRWSATSSEWDDVDDIQKPQSGDNNFWMEWSLIKNWFTTARILYTTPSCRCTRAEFLFTLGEPNVVLQLNVKKKTTFGVGVHQRDSKADNKHEFNVGSTYCGKSANGKWHPILLISKENNKTCKAKDLITSVTQQYFLADIQHKPFSRSMLTLLQGSEESEDLMQVLERKILLPKRDSHNWFTLDPKDCPCTVVITGEPLEEPQPTGWLDGTNYIDLHHPLNCGEMTTLDATRFLSGIKRRTSDGSIHVIKASVTTHPTRMQKGSSQEARDITTVGL